MKSLNHIFVDKPALFSYVNSGLSFTALNVVVDSEYDVKGLHAAFQLIAGEIYEFVEREI